ncbi:PQQ-binding-like beta-propeller repeat protein, partial [bacterium]|nr:PQQ-binding-like beta-propeller repeat protein [bacterium]
SLWYQAEWRLVACDGFNGTRLWEKPIATWNDHLRHFRSGPLHLPRRLVAVGDDVFVTLGLEAPVTRLDAATGEIRNTYKGTERTEEIVCHDGALYLMVGTSEAKRSGAGLSERGEPRPTKSRVLVALDVESGRELWRKNAKGADFVLPLSLTALGDKVFYQDIRGIACVDAQSGAPRWLAKRPTPAKRYGWSTSTLVVTQDVVLCADRKVTAPKGAKAVPAATDIEWGVTCFGVPSIPRRGVNELIAYSTKDGRRLWSAPCGEGYNSPVDVFVVDGMVWAGPGFSKGYDLETGEVRKSFSARAQPVGMVHHRCYRNKASSRFIFTGRDGIELIDVTKGWVGNNSWLRGTCQYGILPANGMLYAPPDACGCHPKARLQGFNALSSALPASAGAKAAPRTGRLTEGPAYAKASAGKPVEDGAWPMYRHDPLRSGATAATVPNAVKLKWATDVGGKLTQPVSAHGKVFVASVDSHTVHALSAADGQKVWSYTAGGRIDSSPTLTRGLAIFGSADGWVTCLDQSDGQLVWRYRAAPEERLLAIHGQFESSWPVHGSVLLHNNDIVFTAGRSSYLDGGLAFHRLDPITGKALAASTITHIDWATGKQTGQEKRGSFDSEGTISDILSGDGESIFLKHMCFDAAGRETKSAKPHLFAPTGMLGEEWFVRAFWLYGTDTGAGYFRWANMKSNASNLAPAGRIMSFDGQRIYGYGRVAHSGSWTGHRGDKYHLFSSVKTYEKPASPAAARRGAKPKKPARTYIWSQESPLIVRAMVLTADKLIVAGIPALARKDKGGLSFVNPKDGLDALRGRRGASLSMISTSDGAKLTEIKLESPPVFDGMSVVPGRVLMSLRNGNVVCYAGSGR